MNKIKIIILPEKVKQDLLNKHNKVCNTNYKLTDIKNIISYKDNTRLIDLIEIVFKDYTKQIFKKDTLEIDNFI